MSSGIYIRKDSFWLDFLFYILVICLKRCLKRDQYFNLVPVTMFG
mgnify:CR=1 FL=1